MRGTAKRGRRNRVCRQVSNLRPLVKLGSPMTVRARLKGGHLRDPLGTRKNSLVGEPLESEVKARRAPEP